MNNVQIISSAQAALIDFDERSAECISPGLDSTVYRKGDRTFKLYDKIGEKQLAEYKELTNRASRLFSYEPLKRQFVLNGNNYTFRFEVLPIEEIGIGAFGKPLSISKFIDSPILMPMSHSVCIHPAIAKKLHSQYLSDPRDRFYVDLAIELQFNHDLSRDMQKAMCDVSDRLNERLFARGIQIEKLNVKVEFDRENCEAIFLITDIGNHVAAVRSK